ncbi:transposase (IS652), partial [Legionella cincinnatiensis]
STVERWYHYGYELRYKKIATRSCPRGLGLDEHSFNRKVGYATTFCDLAKHKIFDVVEGRSARVAWLLATRISLMFDPLMPA